MQKDLIEEHRVGAVKGICEEFDIPYEEATIYVGTTKYEHPDDIAKAINVWLSKCLLHKRTYYADGVKMKEIDPIPLTVSGLTNALKVSSDWMRKRVSREILNENMPNLPANEEGICDVIERAYNLILEDHEVRLAHKATTNPGLLAILKNRFGWHDKQDLDFSSGGKTLAPLFYLPQKDGDAHEVPK